MTHDLAQLNVATAGTGNAQDPALDAFWKAVPGINALADADPELIWRLQEDDTGHAGGFRIPGQDAMIVNLSVWRSLEALHSFVFRSAHRHVMARKGEWFVTPTDPATVLWWVPHGHRPTVDEAWGRLQKLRDQGPSPAAFSFQKRFDPPA